MPDKRGLDHRKTAKIYSLGSKLGLNTEVIEMRVSELQDHREADEAIAIVELL